ncbi:U7 snRNA-associated Sm-like protein LSm11 [Pholidichthys leucotaenia]
MEERRSKTTASESEAAPAADGDADKLDVCSAQFDPLLALYSPAVRLPVPNIRAFNNVAEYESFLKGGRGRAKPENVEKRRLKALKGAADPERIERLKRLMVNKPEPEEGGSGGGAARRKKQKAVKNVLTRMALCKGSPLGELYRCVEEKIRVRVHIRTFKGLRGVCSGFVVAFDKFWNMALVDVDETYREPLFGEAFYHDKPLTISRLFGKLKLQESSGGDAPQKWPEGQKRSSKDGCGHPRRIPQSSSSCSTSTSADTRGGLSTAVKDKKDKQDKITVKYGKVHSRHLKQVFIRGENIVLINPQQL